MNPVKNVNCAYNTYVTDVFECRVKKEVRNQNNINLQESVESYIEYGTRFSVFPHLNKHVMVNYYNECSRVCTRFVIDFLNRP